MAKTDATKVKNNKSGQKHKKKTPVKKASKKIQKGKKADIKAKAAKPQGEIKFYYFDCYAVGEPIRMALHKAGVRYQDIRCDYNPPRQ